MNVVKVNPMFPVKSFSNLIDEMFNRSFPEFNHTLGLTSPSVNITESEDQFLLEVAAPGLSKEDFNISIDKDQLVISTSKNEEKEDKEEGKWMRKEFNFSSFKRSFYLGDHINHENISATYENGILSIQLPKKEEAKPKAPKQITIN